MHKMTPQKGFTLIELLGVIAIIIILVAIALGAGMKLINIAEVKKTKANMLIIMNALTAWSDNLGDGFSTPPPSGEYPNPIRELATALLSEPVSKKSLEKLESDAIITGTDQDGVGYFSFVDAWNTEMRYDWLELGGGTTPRLQSAGPDMTFDTDDDIYSDR